MVSEKTYRAGTLKEALAQVRRDLGGDAVILNTREVRRRRLFGLRPRDQVEVTAAHGSRSAAARAAGIAPGGADGHDPLGPGQPGAATVATSSAGALQSEFGEQLSRLHAMVADLSRHGRIDHLLPELPPTLVPTYATLLEADVPETLARRLVRFVAERLEPDEVHRPDVVRESLRDAVESCVQVAPPIAAVAGTRRVVALVGPTGVGKTTTVAKLAANFKLAQGLKAGLVTVDTYRIAAVEQLRTYAEIIDLPLAVANSPARCPGRSTSSATSTSS